MFRDAEWIDVRETDTAAALQAVMGARRALVGWRLDPLVGRRRAPSGDAPQRLMSHEQRRFAGDPWARMASLIGPTALDSETGEVVLAALLGLMFVSVLLTLRAIDSGNWLTMWVASLVSLTATLVAIWSIGSLTFLLTCLQVAAAVALRRSVGLPGWIALLLAGLAAFGLIIYGLAFARAWDLWLIVIPLAFALTSLHLIADLPMHRR